MTLGLHCSLNDIIKWHFVLCVGLEYVGVEYT